MNLQLVSKIKSIFEDLVVVIVMVGIFLPVRLIFYNLISDNWFGSFGLISIIVITLVILSKKNKLGWFGRTYWKSITRVHKGKRRIFSYFMIGMMIYLNASVVFGINLAQSNEKVIHLISNPTDLQNVEGLEPLQEILGMLSSQDTLEPDLILDQYAKIPPETIITGFTAVFFMPILDPVSWAAYVSLADDLTGGWALHFTTVFLIESMEIVGILSYTYIEARRSVKNNQR